MTYRLWSTMLWVALLAPAQPKCIGIEGDRIVAADMAVAVPEFSSLPSSVPLAAAPDAGVRRVFHRPEILSIAKRYAVRTDGADSVCFERPMQPLQRDEVLSAMRSALKGLDAQIEIAEMSDYRAPRGKLEFKLESLHRPALPDARTPTQWRGDVVYAGGRRFSIWARVIVSAKVRRAVAAVRIRKGEEPDPSHLRFDTIDAFPPLPPDDVVRSLEDVVGRSSLRDIEAGTELKKSFLTPFAEVRRGQDVQIEVRNGAARVAFTGKAQTTGRLGQAVVVRNPLSNRTFEARVSGKGKAVLDLERALGN